MVLLRGFLLATQGTMMSANMAIKRKKVIHVGGGLHHAHFKGGSGFCIYNDIGLACKYLLDYHGDKVKKILILDLDAHQGNGHERDKEILGNNIIIADIYNPYIFPRDEYAKKFINFSRTVSIQDTSKEYLAKLEDMLCEIKRWV
jgi:histone deacetylase 11